MRYGDERCRRSAPLFFFSESPSSLDEQPHGLSYTVRLGYTARIVQKEAKLRRFGVKEPPSFIKRFRRKLTKRIVIPLL